ncbi:RNA 2',3'-cyclic phosphodiesterase [Lysobacter humi (ex Lee et al. 2017)]
MTDDPSAVERPGEAHRLFLALWPDDDVRAALDRATDAVDAFRGQGRRVATAKLHITLHFLGGGPASPEATIGRVRAAVGDVCARGFHLVIDHAGSFHGARVGWLAPGGNSGLDALWSDLGHVLDAAGIEARRHERFAPHVTVLRAFHGRVDDVPIEPISWPVQEFVLVHSHGGRYDVVERWPLEPA